MLDKQSPETYVAIGTFVGVALTKLLGVIIAREYTDSFKIRQELRLEVKRLSDDLKRLSEDVDTWKDKYYELVEENLKLKSECERLELQISDLRSEVGAASRSPEAML